MMAMIGYDEKTLAEFMHQELGRLADVLGYSVGVNDAGSYAQAVTEVMLRAGVEDLSQVKSLQVRALARVELWRKVCADLGSMYDFAADGASLKRGQMFTHAQINLAGATLLALEYDPAYCVGRGNRPNRGAQ